MRLLKRLIGLLLICGIITVLLYNVSSNAKISSISDFVQPRAANERKNSFKHNVNESGLDDFNIIVSGVDNGESKMKREKTKVEIVIADGEKACKIPKLEMNAKEVIGFFKPSDPAKCSSKQQNWAYVDSLGKFALITERERATCTAIIISRVSDDKLKYSDSIPIKKGDSMPSDFTKIMCSLGIKKWDGLLMSAVRNDNFIKRSKNKKQPSDWSGLDVLFLGMDSLSQMTYRRKLPKTVSYLENLMEAVVLDGYNIVGDGTPQAFIPILTAKTEEELPLTRKRFKESQYVDEAYPFIWKNFSDAGYVTAYGEDAAEIGTFTYRLKGFKNEPTDHFTRTYFQESEKLYGPGRCAGSESLHKSWFRYVKEFMRSYSDVPRFLLMHLSMFSHDDINLAGSIDDDFAAHLKEMFEEGYFDNALVILMADHGHRFAKLRSTHQGQLEERLPFFSFALPKKFREGKGKTAWTNLINNKDFLSTPFDIHATLMDILHWPSEDTLKTVQDPANRSLSLFRPIPIGRTCDQAGVEPHWCTCLNWEDALSTPKEEVLSQRIANAIVSVINDQTEKERASCAPLKLKKLIHSKKMVPNEGLLKYKNVKDADGFVPDLSGSTNMAFAFYQIKLETTPGKAIYEVTVRYEISTNKLNIDLTAMSHVNKFGDAPHCIIDRNYFLATYCVCYDKINTKDSSNRS